MAKEVIYQIIRFILTGAFNHTEPNITSMIFEINRSCLVLLDILLLYSKKSKVEDEYNNSRFIVLREKGYKNPIALSYLDRFYIRDEL